MLTALVVAPLGVEAPPVRADATSMAGGLANSTVEPGMLPHKAIARAAQVSEPRVLKGAGLLLVAALLALAMVLGRVRNLSGATEREAKDLALLIRAGALPVPVEIVEQRSSCLGCSPGWARPSTASS